MQVPVYKSPTVQENALPVTQQNPNLPSGAFGENIARGLGDVSTVLQKVQDDADNLRVQDTYNQLREQQLDLTLSKDRGYANVKGRDVVMPRENGQSLSGDYMQRFDTIGSFLEGNLANEAQKLKFRQKMEQSRLDFRAGLQRHENQEITAYGKSVANATVTLETEAAAKQWNSPELIGRSIQNITDSLNAQGTREGIPADVVKAAIQDKVSNVHSNVLALAIESKNLPYANEYLKQYGRDMTAADTLKYKGAIDQEMRTDEAVATAHTVYGRLLPSIQPTDMDRLTTLVAGQESGNRERDAHGNLITSTKEQQGKMQAMLKNYGGDVNKALAAYNAGPGAVDQAIKDAKDGKTYLDLLPKETQDYVASVGGKYASGAGMPQRITLEELHNNVRKEMAGKPASQVTIAIDQATRLFEDNQKAKKQREDDAFGEAMKQLDANGGNYPALPVLLRMSLAGDKIDNLQEYARKKASGIDITTDWNIYYELKKDDRLLAQTNLLAFKNKLADGDFNALVRDQEALRKPGADSVTATRSANQILNSYMLELGIDTTPKPSTSDTSDAAKMGRAMRAQQEAITAAEQAKGGKLTPLEIEQETARLFSNVGIKGMIFGTN
jgi:soluble lytic murein transglycosylase